MYWLLSYHGSLLTGSSCVLCWKCFQNPNSAKRQNNFIIKTGEHKSLEKSSTRSAVLVEVPVPKPSPERCTLFCFTCKHGLKMNGNSFVICSQKIHILPQKFIGLPPFFQYLSTPSPVSCCRYWGTNFATSL